MNKKDFPKNLVNKIDEKAATALENGKGQRVYGGGLSGIKVGDIYTLTGVTFTEQLMPDSKKITTSEWNKLTEDEKVASGMGVLRSWFSFTSNNGNLAFASVQGEKEMYSEEYWKDVTTKVDDFDVTKLFRPSARTAEAWTAASYDNLIGKTIKCVATKEYTPEGQDFDIRVRAWVIVD